MYLGVTAGVLLEPVKRGLASETLKGNPQSSSVTCDRAPHISYIPGSASAGS
jgi:hypothetical protein